MSLREGSAGSIGTAQTVQMRCVVLLCTYCIIMHLLYYYAAYYVLYYYAAYYVLYYYAAYYVLYYHALDYYIMYCIVLDRLRQFNFIGLLCIILCIVLYLIP